MTKRSAKHSQSNFLRISSPALNLENCLPLNHPKSLSDRLPPVIGPHRVLSRHAICDKNRQFEDTLSFWRISSFHFRARDFRFGGKFPQRAAKLFLELEADDVKVETGFWFDLHDAETRSTSSPNQDAIPFHKWTIAAIPLCPPRNLQRCEI